MAETAELISLLAQLEQSAEIIDTVCSRNFGKQGIAAVRKAAETVMSKVLVIVFPKIEEELSKLKLDRGIMKEIQEHVDWLEKEFEKQEDIPSVNTVSSKCHIIVRLLKKGENAVA
ncbi:hypothetical protein HY486_04495 [Candidatus Woesearchaeota archaeon]|nr:hypothetical protein [Candidatus Woesearchaeota archaeon]